MPRSSRHKSHKQSKHSSKDVRDYSDSEEDVKMKERTSKEEGSVRVLKDSASGEKRKLASQSRDVKDLSSHGNGDASVEYVTSKRRKEKTDGGGGNRWNGSGDKRGDGGTIEKEMKGESSRIDLDKGSKSKESKVVSESKSKSSTRRHDSGSEKKEENGGMVVAEKDESKSGSRVDSKRKSEKDSGRKESHQYKESKELKDKDVGSERERERERESKVHDNKRDAEVRAVGGEDKKKQVSHILDTGNEGQGKRDWPVQDELRNPELEKELEKRVQRRRHGSTDKDKYQDDIKPSDDKRLSSRSDRVKDGRPKDETHVEKYREDGDKDDRHKDDSYREDGEKVNRHRDVKYREEGERDKRHRNDEHREDGDKDNRRRDDKHREDGDRDSRHRDDKYREDGDRDGRHRDNKHREDGDKDNRRNDHRYREDGERDDRHKDNKYREDRDRDNRHKEEKHREDVDRESGHRDGKQGDDPDREKRLRDVKYREELSSRERPSDKSDTKRVRDDNTADIYRRKSNNRDGSPSYDDRNTRYKDDQARRRAYDKEDHSDIRSRSTNEQRSDAEKRSLSGAKPELVTDRGRSNSRNADSEFTLNHSRRRRSPSSSSHVARDPYRFSKQEESKYRDYTYEERVRHNVISGREYAGAAGGTEKNSLSRSVEKHIQGNLVESAERRPRSDARGSPLQLVDKSPSSASTERRHFNRSDVRRNLDVEESGHRNGGSKDTRDYSVKEGRGSRELPMETFPVDELSQADGDTSSVSSPFPRASHFSGNSKSILPPPPPFRTGVDSHVVLGSPGDENRGMSSNRNRRIGDPNMGRVQGSAWKGIPSWPSPLGNGFMPFQHGPPVGFHPVMHQYPAPPIFGVRPSMELNHMGVPYHISDGDRFSGRGRPLGWRNPVDDSCPPPLHGWDANNAIVGDESHIYGRRDWDHSRTLPGSRGWESSRDVMKGQNGVRTNMPSPQKEDYSAYGPGEEVWAGRSGQKDQSEQNQPDIDAGSIDLSLSSDTFERNTPEVPKTVPEETPSGSEISEKDGALLCYVYFSKLDISADLTHPELYNHCTSLKDMDQSTISDVDNSKIVYLEEAAEAKSVVPNKTSNASIFAAINDSVFQKAMSLYKKQREDIRVSIGGKTSFSTVESLEFVPTSSQEKAGLNDGKPEVRALASDQQEVESAVPKPDQENAKLQISVQRVDGFLPATCQKLDEPVVANSMEKLQEFIPTSNTDKMELDLVSNLEKVEYVVEEKSSLLENVEGPDAFPTRTVEDINMLNNSGGSNSDNPTVEDMLSNSGGSHSGNNNEEHIDTKSSPLLSCDVSSDPCQAMLPESIESGLVNFSRIHHSPESTH